MKKLLTSLAFVLACLLANGQQEKGDRVLNANLSFSKQKGQDASSTINLKAGKFFTQNLEVGVNELITINSGFTFMIAGAYGNYNVVLEGSKMVPYIGANLGIIAFSGKNITGETDLSFGANAGMRYFFAEKTFFDAGLTYNSYKLFNVSTNTIGLNFGLGVIIGSLK